MKIIEKIKNRNVRLRKYIGIPFAISIILIWTVAVLLLFIPCISFSTSIVVLLTVILTTAFGIYGWIQATTSTLSNIKFNILDHTIAPPHNRDATQFPVVFVAEGGLPFNIRFAVNLNGSSDPVNDEGNNFWKGREVKYPPSAAYEGASFHINQTSFQNKDKLMVEIFYTNMFVKVIGIVYRWYYDSGRKRWVLDIT